MTTTPEGEMLPLGQGSDDYQTPPEALGPLLPHLQPGWTIWECACGKSRLVQALRQARFTVIGTDTERDFLTWQPDHFDCIVTNPPYSLKSEFLRRAYGLGKPFAFLLPITGLETKPRQWLFQAHGIDLILLSKRLRFETPTQQKSRPWFYTVWFCWGLGLPRQLNFATAGAGQGQNLTISAPDNKKGLTMRDTPDTPNDGPLEGFPHPAPEPTDQSSLDELDAYALVMINQFQRQDKKSGEYIWKMGRALQWVYEKLNATKGYGYWQKW